jgi:hypothetical protein
LATNLVDATPTEQVIAARPRPGRGSSGRCAPAAEAADGARDVQERLVQAERLDGRRDAAEDLHHAARHLA